MGLHLNLFEKLGLKDLKSIRTTSTTSYLRFLMMLFSTGTGLERVGVAGSDPNSWLIGDAGYWIVGAGVGLLLLLIGRL